MKKKNSKGKKLLFSFKTSDDVFNYVKKPVERLEGKTKTSLVVDEKLWQDFSIVVIRKEGNRKKNDVIVEFIKDYVKKNGGMQK